MDKEQQKKILIEIMESDAKDKLYAGNHPFRYASLRQITDSWERGEISYGKMVEMLNDIAIKWHENHIVDTNKMVEHHIVDTNKMITAVEWLVKDLIERHLIKEDDYIKTFINKSFEQAKAMEKEQIMKAWDRAYAIGGANGSNDWVYECELTDNSEYYYNETYNNEKDT